jgi:hypothetical protein
VLPSHCAAELCNCELCNADSTLPAMAPRASHNTDCNDEVSSTGSTSSSSGGHVWKLLLPLLLALLLLAALMRFFQACVSCRSSRCCRALNLLASVICTVSLTTAVLQAARHAANDTHVQLNPSWFSVVCSAVCMCCISHSCTSVAQCCTKATRKRSVCMNVLIS